MLRTERSETSRPLLLVAEPNDFSSSALTILERVADVHLSQVASIDLERVFKTYDAFWFRLGHRIDASVLGSDCRCRLIATPVTGVDHIDLAACAAAGVQVVSLRGEVSFLRSVRATAELTVALALSLLRRIPSAAQHVLNSGWNRDLFRGQELYGKRAAIIGVGRLGTLVAELLHAFGMQVYGYDPRADFPQHVAISKASLDEALEEADVVTLHASLDDSTRHLIGPDQFGRMKTGAVLINTSRGAIVDESALLRALQSGRLAGAALDVLADEPAITSGHPLVVYARAHDNLLIVPHIGGNTKESFEKTEVFLAERVARALAGPDSSGGEF